MLEPIKNHLLFCILFMIIVAVVAGLLLFFYIFYESKEASQAKLKQFSVEFSKLALEDQNKMTTYKKYLQNKEIVKLNDHPDFFYFWKETAFFNDLMQGFGGVSVPYKDFYGFCAVLTGNYSSIREKITNESFIPKVESSFLKIYAPCDAVQLKNVLSKAQNIMSRHETVLDYGSEELLFVSQCIDPYLLYLYSVENPSLAKCLRAEKFCNFFTPDPMP